MNKEQLTQQYQQVVRQHLDKLTDRLVMELGVVAQAKHDPDTYLIQFEVEMQDFTCGFPIYWIPLDKDTFQLESNLRLGLLTDIPFTVPADLVDAVAYKEADVETSELGYDILIVWFGDCWRRAGGLECFYPAYITPHDSFFSINLNTMQDVTDDDKWPSAVE